MLKCAQNLIKVLSNCQPCWITFGFTFCKSFSSVSDSELDNCFLNHLWHAAYIWQSLVQFHGFLTELLFSVCSITAREGLWWFTVCPVLSAQRALLVGPTHGPQHEVMALLPDGPRAVCWGCVMDLWACGILCFWQLVMWDTCKLNSSWLVPPCSDTLG